MSRAKFAIVQLCRAPSCSRCCRLPFTPDSSDLPPLPSFRQVLVIPTDEELSIAQQTLDVIRQTKGVAAAA